MGITLDFNFIFEMLLLVALGIALAVLGYLIKGIWGALIALGAGAFLFFYFKGFLPF